MKILHHRAFPPFLLAALCLLITSIIWLGGLPEGHDYHNQIVSYELFKSQLSDGDLLPRWLKDANSGLGGMNFFFYPVLSYYSTYFVDLFLPAALSTKYVLGLSASLFVLLSGLSAYYFFRTLASKSIAFGGALLYAVLPYHLSYDLVIRNALSETGAYIWLPLIFAFLRPDKLKSKRGTIALALSYCALILTHIPSALLFSIIIGAYCFMNLLTLKSWPERREYTLSCSFAIFSGIGLSAAFWLPAITMLDHVNAEFFWSGYFEYSRWFLFPFSGCHIDAYCEGPRIFALMQFTLPVIAFFLFFKNKERSAPALIQYFTLSALCLFLMSAYSNVIWSAIPILQKVQFPWRLMAASDFIYVTLLVLVFSNVPWRKITTEQKIFATLIMLIGFYAAADTYRGATKYGFEVLPNYDQAALEHSYKSKNTHYEYIPQNQYSKALTFGDQLEIKQLPFTQTSRNNVSVEVLEHKSRRVALSINAPEEFTLELRQFYLPEWKAVIDMQNAAIASLRATPPYGQIAMDLPKGEYNIVLTLPLFASEKFGLCIALLSLLILALYGFRFANKPQ